MWWLTTVALAGEPFVELGGGFGTWVAPPPETTEWTPGFFASPKLGIWPGARVGVEIDVGLVAGPSGIADGLSAVVPRVAIAVDPIGPSPGPVHPRIVVGAGVDVERHRGALRIDPSGQPTDPWRSVSWMVSGGVGLDVRLAGALHLRVDVIGMALGGAPGRPDALRPGLTATVGIATRFRAGRDRDRDGVMDRLDLCPDEAEDLDGFQDEDGCRDPDNDGDGIRDELDACDDEPEDFDGVEDDDGCPEG